MIQQEKDDAKEFVNVQAPSTPIKPHHHHSHIASEGGPSSNEGGGGGGGGQATMAERHADFVAMRSSLFDWLKAPVSLGKEDLSEKKVMRISEGS
jgi:hypothetical protein